MEYNSRCYTHGVTGTDLREARQTRAMTQQQVAAKLGVSQAYVSMLESSRRLVPRHVAQRLVALLEMPATTLPVRDGKAVNGDQARRALGALGYDAFAYLAAGRPRNPAELLLSVLRADDVEARVVEALPWLVVRFADLDWEWLVPAAKHDDLQNRLGFVLSLGKGLAAAHGHHDAARRLADWEHRLEKSRLQADDSFARRAMTEAEARWLRSHRSPEAAQWNVLSSLTVQALAHAT